LATTIETVKDIDAVADIDDIILIDSPEKLEGKVLNYPDHFKKVIYINSLLENIEFNGAEVIDLCKDGSIIATEIKASSGNNRGVYIFGDSDYNTILVKNANLFKDLKLDLYWGVYFFVKYEDELKKEFNELIESEDYYDLLENYDFFITSNIQVALEAKINDKKVFFLDLKSENSSKIEFIRENGIIVLDKLEEINKSNMSEKLNINLKNINNLIVSIIKSYM